MREYLLIILPLLTTGCFYSHTQYRPSSNSSGTHTQRESLYINKQDYQLNINTHINDDYFLVQVSAEKSKIPIHVDMKNINLKDPISNRLYKPTSHSYWVYDNGIIDTNEKDISHSVIAIKFSPEAIESTELNLYLPFTNIPSEHIKLTKESVILPMTIN